MDNPADLSTLMSINFGAVWIKWITWIKKKGIKQRCSIKCPERPKNKGKERKFEAGLNDWKNEAGIRLLAYEIALKISKNRYKTLYNALKYDEKCIFFLQHAQMWMKNSKIITGKNGKRFRVWRKRKVIHNHSSTIEP